MILKYYGGGITMSDFGRMSVEVFFGLLERTYKQETEAIDKGGDHRAFVEEQLRMNQGD